MDTWGRRGFAAAAITGGMIGLSGAGTEVPSAQWGGGAPDPDPRRSRRSAADPAVDAGRYATPDYPPDYRGQSRTEHRPAEAAQQAMPNPVANPVANSMPNPVQPEQVAPRHATPAYPAAAADGSYAAAEYPGAEYPGAEYPGGDYPRTEHSRTDYPGPGYSGAEYPTGGLPRVAAKLGARGSDGFLAGDLAALSGPNEMPLSGTPVGALSQVEASLSTSFGTYGAVAPAAELGGRSESRHARPEHPDQYSERSGELYAERSGELYAERSGELYAERPAERYTERPAELYAERPAERYTERSNELYAQRPGELYAERPAEQYTERSAELYAQRPAGGDLYRERPAEVYRERPTELYGDRPAELYAGHPAELYRDALGGEAQTVGVPRVSSIGALSQSSMSTNPAPGQPGPSAYQPANRHMGQPTTYPAEQPVRSVELVGASYPGGGLPHSAPMGQHGQHGQSLDSETSALGSLDSSAMFGSLSRPPR
ncbi:MAG TPA: hypothetical protein VK735_10420 [Pseudonocardia sp.]|uniref:hypothetical protein n=1 Tax=Pseudonocardia sp. TaxID=60912 RepID=UPI002C82BC80|nr:hypothetical protein [Pseudonocardia sp.]HTF47853.1 hypothetical protein [Pseudonocardia sp.]